MKRLLTLALAVGFLLPAVAADNNNGTTPEQLKTACLSSTPAIFGATTTAETHQPVLEREFHLRPIPLDPHWRTGPKAIAAFACIPHPELPGCLFCCFGRQCYTLCE